MEKEKNKPEGKTCRKPSTEGSVQNVHCLHLEISTSAEIYEPFSLCAWVEKPLTLTGLQIHPSAMILGGHTQSGLVVNTYLSP